MKNLSFLFLLPILLITISCSSSNSSFKSNENKDPEIYVFDDVTNIDSSLQRADILELDISTIMDKVTADSVIAITFDKIPHEAIPEISTKYIIQLGAFSNEVRANDFVKQNRDKITMQMNVVFVAANKLFAVQLPPFSDRNSAEQNLISMKNILAFKDAFILTVEE